MRIGIIGAGHIGGTLARALSRLGHDVSLASKRGLEKLKPFADEIGAKPVNIEQAARENEVVIIAIPENAYRELPPDLFKGVPDDVVVADTGNYYPELRDGRIEAIDSGEPDSQWVSEQLGRPVVKVFNNIYFESLRDKGCAKGAAGRIALSIAGGTPQARAVVIRLVDQLGFDTVETGDLDESWRQQPGTPAYCHDLDTEHLKQALSEADKSRVPEYRSDAEDAAKQAAAAHPQHA